MLNCLVLRRTFMKSFLIEEKRNRTIKVSLGRGRDYAKAPSGEQQHTLWKGFGCVGGYVALQCVWMLGGLFAIGIEMKSPNVLEGARPVPIEAIVM